MRLLAKDGTLEKLIDEGISFGVLGKACGLSSIDPVCVHILIQFGVNVASIAARSEDEIREELAMLLDRQFALLQTPKDLKIFLCSRLAENSWRMAEHYHDTDIRPQPLPPSSLARPMKGIAECAPACVRGVSGRTQATQEVVAVMSERVQKDKSDDLFICGPDEQKVFSGFMKLLPDISRRF
jgi:hypothetical protein